MWCFGKLFGYFSYLKYSLDHAEYVGGFKSNIDLINKNICIIENSVKNAQKVGKTVPVHSKEHFGDFSCHLLFLVFKLPLNVGQKETVKVALQHLRLNPFVNCARFKKDICHLAVEKR